MRVLELGFMYTSNNDYGNTYVPFDPQEYVESQEFKDYLDTIITKLDMIFLSFHLGFESPTVHKTFSIVRQYILEQYNYTVPIHVFTGHDHIKLSMPCLNLEDFGFDKQCYLTDTGSYLKYVDHIVWELEETEIISPNNGTFKGMQVVSHYLFDDQDFVPEVLANRFNKTVDEFNTPDGL